MSRFSIICDVEKCTGCYACFLACKDEYVGNSHGAFSAPASEGQQWINIREIEYGSGDKVKVDYIPRLASTVSPLPVPPARQMAPFTQGRMAL